MGCLVTVAALSFDVCACVGAQDAISTLRSMGMAGVVPSTDTFNTLMSACLSKGDPGAVPRLFRRLISLGHTPDTLSYTSLITSLTRLGRPEDAVRPLASGLASCLATICVAAPFVGRSLSPPLAIDPKLSYSKRDVRFGLKGGGGVTGAGVPGDGGGCARGCGRGSAERCCGRTCALRPHGRRRETARPCHAAL